MASDRSQSSQAPSRAQSSSVNGAEHGVNGEAHHLSDEASEPGLHEDVGSEDGDGDGDLFGDDGDEDAILKPGDRKLEDAELDSGDDEGRRDRIADTIEDNEDDGEAVEDQVVQIYPTDIGRMVEPEPGDLFVLNLPPFLALKPENFDPETYEIPTTNHGTDLPPPDKFSPFCVASTTAFWRHDPQDLSRLQSNTRIVRWSDGTLTFQIASQPRDHYRISTTALRQDFGRANNKKASEQHDYNPDKDSQHYLAAPHAKAEVLRIIHPFSAAMKILPSGEQTDEAVLALQKSLAAAEAIHDPFAAIRNVKEDPELGRKRAELAEKDKLRAERKREAQIERETGRKEKVLGRRGLGRGGVGLTVGGLEDEDGMPTAKARKPARRVNRRGDIYSDDEDDGYPRGRTREDEYDQEDGFLANSDEEPEIFEDEDEEAGEDDPDVDDLEIEGRETVVKAKSRNERQGTPKRSQGEVEEDAGAVESPHARKKRRVIDDDEDDDDEDVE